MPAETTTISAFTPGACRVINNGADVTLTPAPINRELAITPPIPPIHRSFVPGPLPANAIHFVKRRSAPDR